MNGALRRALDDAQMAEDDLAGQLGVDPKTVRRWIAGRRPYRRHRVTVATILNTDEADLWPRATTPPAVPQPLTNEILATYPHRWAVPRSVWTSLFESATNEIGILVYAGLFLAEDAGILRGLSEKARDGVKVRILLGDPESPRVSARGEDEGIGASINAKVRNALVLYRPLVDTEGIEIRLHDTVLYNSIYRADDQLLINPHIYGVAASNAPLLHLRRLSDADMAHTYVESFERVWEDGKPLR